VPFPAAPHQRQFSAGVWPVVLGAGLQGVLEQRGITRATIYLDDLLLGLAGGIDGVCL